jgi:hypothetical protein
MKGNVRSEGDHGIDATPLQRIFVPSCFETESEGRTYRFDTQSDVPSTPGGGVQTSVREPQEDGGEMIWIPAEGNAALICVQIEIEMTIYAA